MRELTPMTELNDTELDAVSGGFLNGLGNITTQTNNAVQVGVAIGFGSLVTNVGQILAQANFSA
jgi:bacteriocin-like protein